MRIIIDCEPGNLDAAFALARQEIADNYERRYNKPGWGWHFPMGTARAFVRGIKGGISIKQVKP